MKTLLELYNLDNMCLYEVISKNDFSKKELKELLLSFIFYYEYDKKTQDVLKDTIERL